ncbi:MAG: hypothetical protein AB7U79_06900 [Candidatus Izemoplasmatales bacterium]
MRQHKKPKSFYYTVFGLTSLIVLGYSLYLYFSVGASVSELWILWLLPLPFTMIYYGGDALMQWIANKTKKVDEEGDFYALIAKKMTESKTFFIEEFRKLQRSSVFQTQMHVAFEIYKNGESEIYTVEKLKKKFRADSLEGRAMAFAIQIVEEKLTELSNN